MSTKVGPNLVTFNKS